MQIQKGDMLIYGTFGLCRVKEISLISFSGDVPKESYIILSPVSSPMSTYYIPEKNAVSQLRFPLTAEEINELITKAKAISINWIDNRQLRSDSFRNILSKGVSAELIALLHCLYQRREKMKADNKSLSATDDAIFTGAEKLIHEEFSFCLKISKDSVNEYISRIFEATN